MTKNDNFAQKGGEFEQRESVLVSNVKPIVFIFPVLW